MCACPTAAVIRAGSFGIAAAKALHERGVARERARAAGYVPAIPARA
jgi:hypothetical protein